MIVRILLVNGWHLLPNDSVQVKLKWVAIPKPIHFRPQAGYMMNHFKDSYKLTTKLGLYNLLSSAHGQKLTDDRGENYLGFFPRSYDLGSEFESFCCDFTHTAVLNLMKKLMIHIEIVHEKTLYPKYKSICQRLNFINQEEALTNEIEIGLKHKQEIFEHQPSSQRVFFNKTIFLNLLKYWKHYFQGTYHSKIFSTLTHSLKTFSKLNPPFDSDPRFSKHSDPHFSKYSDLAFLTHSSVILFFKLYFYCIQTNPNFLNDGLNNIWIIKSNQSSRGRNIFLIDDLEQVQSYKNGGNRLIQKYIENVWILNSQNLGSQIHNEKIYKILNKKFDLRFWVLVKSFTPLDAYIFSEGYLRLSSENYQFMNKGSLQENLKTHLTNFSVNFLPYLKNQRPTAEDSECEEDNSYLLFSDFLNFVEGNQQSVCEDVTESELFKKIVKILSHILTIAAVNWRVCESDRNSFELFGFDIILDSELEPYVLECNMSPACHERGELKGLVNEMGEGLLEMIGVIKEGGKEEGGYEKGRRWVRVGEELGEGESQGRVRMNFQDLVIVGEGRSSQWICEQDFGMEFSRKVVVLQRFFRERYRKCIRERMEREKMQKRQMSKMSRIQKIDLQRKCRRDEGLRKVNKISMSCGLIQVLARVVKKREKKCLKKLIKYLKKMGRKKGD